MLVRRLIQRGTHVSKVLGACRWTETDIPGDIDIGTGRSASSTSNHSSRWGLLKDRGVRVNPCRSVLHPSAEEGISIEEGEELPIQAAYTPSSECFGCGPSSSDGLHLKSHRIENGLESTVSFQRKHCAFPGMVNGGIVTTAFDCAGNWTAAIALMDVGCLPNPPLTVVAEMLVTYVEPTPPDEELFVRTEVVDIISTGEIGSKSTVHVSLKLVQKTPIGEKLLCKGEGVFKKLGALRAL
jgi:acyl-coenzyme A thioesterase PaaI-like protein